MTVTAQVHCYIDQSVMGVWHEWGRARDDVTVVGELEGTAPGDQDEDWIPVVAAAGLIVIGRDKRFRTRPAEVALLRSHGLRYVWLGGKQEAAPLMPDLDFGNPFGNPGGVTGSISSDQLDPNRD